MVGRSRPSGCQGLRRRCASARDRASSSSSNVVAASGGVAWACGAGGVASSWAGSGLEASPDAAGACSRGSSTGDHESAGRLLLVGVGSGAGDSGARTDAAVGGVVVVPASGGVVLAIQFSSSESTSCRSPQRSNQRFPTALSRQIAGRGLAARMCAAMAASARPKVLAQQ